MKEKQTKWIKIGSKGTSYLARYNTVYKAINKYMKEISGIPNLLENYKYIEYTNYGSDLYLQELDKLYNRVQNKIGGIEAYIKLRKNNYKRYLREIKKLASTISNKISNKELITIYKQVDDIYGQANGYLGFGTLYTDCLTRKLKKKFGKRYLEFDFSSKTRLSKYNDELLRLSKIKNELIIKKVIDKILKKYYWIGSFFLVGNELNKKQILEDMRNVQKLTKNKITKNKMVQDSLITEMKILSRDRNEELEQFMELEYFFKKILYKIAKRLKIDFDTLTYCSPYELIDSLEGKALPLNNIKRRKILFGFLIKNDQVSEYYGHQAEFLLEHQNVKIQIIKGFVACQSKKKIEGMVKIVRSSDDIKKVKKGNILVTIMTTPNYLQAIYNSAAIVTDEGGITCHAAIIARELNKPCIIGTKIATKILKDGDLVEVDANRGIVKILR